MSWLSLKNEQNNSLLQMALMVESTISPNELKSLASIMFAATGWLAMASRSLSRVPPPILTATSWAPLARAWRASDQVASKLLDLWNMYYIVIVSFIILNMLKCDRGSALDNTATSRAPLARAWRASDQVESKLFDLQEWARCVNVNKRYAYMKTIIS